MYGEEEWKKNVTIITSSFVAGGIKVIKSLLSVNTGLPCPSLITTVLSNMALFFPLKVVVELP